MPPANGRTRKVGMWFSSSPKTWEPGTPVSESRRWVSQLMLSKWIYSSVLVLNWLGDARARWWKTALLSLQIQMLISSRRTLKDIPRKTVLPEIWASVSSVKVTVLVWAKLMGPWQWKSVSTQNFIYLPSWTWDPLPNLSLMWLPRPAWNCRWQGTQHLLSGLLYLWILLLWR